MAKILVGCEKSQAITIELRNLGYEAYSCDILPCSGGHPEWHIQGDIFDAISSSKWDAMIAHPPCTYLAVSGMRWLSHPDDKDLPFDHRRPHPLHPNRREYMIEAINFAKRLLEVDIPYIAIENPVGLLSTKLRKPDQIIQPWQFGDEAQKTTCLWLKGFPKLKYTNVVGKGEFFEFTDSKTGKTKRQPMWYANAKGFGGKSTSKDHQSTRSETFPGIAKAIADQWGAILK